MKLRNVAIIIFLILFIDQFSKIYIKLHYPVGEITRVMGFDWFRLNFIENDGMAWGLSFGNQLGKLVLTLFRLVAVVVGTWYIVKIVKDCYHKGFITCVALIYSGALGNLIDSMFYGLIFDKGLRYVPEYNKSISYDGVAQFSTDGYSSFLHGSVVDMLYFPFFEGTYPQWVPYLSGEPFVFFSAIFNVADASISIGIIVFLLFQKRFLVKPQSAQQSTLDDSSQVV